MARNYGAEYAARRARADALAAEAGISRSEALRITTGHARRGTPGMAAIREQQLRAGQSFSDAARAVGAGTTPGEPSPYRGAKTDAGSFGPGGVMSFIDTSSKADALRFLRQAAAEGKSVEIIGTRGKGAHSDGVPLFGGDRIEAQYVLDALVDEYEGDIWDFIDGEAGDNYGSSVAVVRVHMTAL